MAVSAAAAFVLQTILSVIWLSDVEGPSIPVILLSVCVAVCILDITLPMMFRFGVEKGRLAMFLIIFLVCASAGGIATIEQSSLDGGFYLSLSLVPAAIAAVVLTILPEWLRFLQDYRMLIYAVVLIGMMLFNASPKLHGWVVSAKKSIAGFFRKLFHLQKKEAAD